MKFWSGWGKQHIDWSCRLIVRSTMFFIFHSWRTFAQNYSPMFLELPKCPTLDALDTEPETVLECRLVKKGNSVVPQVLIKWTGLPADRVAWEDWEVLKTRFPSVLAWGQATRMYSSLPCCDFGIENPNSPVSCSSSSIILLFQVRHTSESHAGNHTGKGAWQNYWVFPKLTR
jgi:hypothetical protein